MGYQEPSHQEPYQEPSYQEPHQEPYHTISYSISHFSSHTHTNTISYSIYDACTNIGTFISTDSSYISANESPHKCRRNPNRDTLLCPNRDTLLCPNRDTLLCPNR